MTYLSWRLLFFGLVTVTLFSVKAEADHVRWVAGLEGTLYFNDCSASLIRLENSKPEDAGLIMTNGHCARYPFLHLGEVIYQSPVRLTFLLRTALSNQRAEIHSTKLIYASMTKTDIALFQAEESYSEILKAFHIRPFLLSSRHPDIGTPIEVISGYWSKIYSCQIEFFVPHLKEGEWLWEDSLRYSRPGCEVIGGTSGSPVVEAGTRRVIAINNTVNDAGELCTINNPCEIDTGGKNPNAKKGFAYGQQTYLIYTCLNEKNQFDFARPECKL